MVPLTMDSQKYVNFATILAEHVFLEPLMYSNLNAISVQTTVIEPRTI